MDALAGGEAQRAVGADGDAVGLAVAAAGGAQRGGDAAAFAGGDGHAVAGGGHFGAGLPAAGGPGVAEVGAQGAAGGVGDGEGDVGRSPSRTEVSPVRVKRSVRTGAARA